MLFLCNDFRCRLRKKTWKNPGNIYVDNQAYVDDIQIFANWEVFLEVLDGKGQVNQAQYSQYKYLWPYVC